MFVRFHVIRLNRLLCGRQSWYIVLSKCGVWSELVRFVGSISKMIRWVGWKWRICEMKGRGSELKEVCGVLWAGFLKAGIFDVVGVGWMGDGSRWVMSI